MKTVNTHEAKTQLSRLLRRVAAGEEVVIANRGVGVARLVPIALSGGQRVLGDLQGQIQMAEDFDLALPESVLAAFEGRARTRRRKKVKKRA